MNGLIWFVLEVLLYGALWTYLILVIPAAVVTALKEDWILFLLGFISFGASWFAGAAVQAKPASWWARRYYPGQPGHLGEGGSDEGSVSPEGSESLESQARQQAQIELRGWRQRRRRRVLLVVTTGLVLLGLFSARPTPILGIDAKSLQYSIDPIFAFADRCNPRPDGNWTCFSYDNSSSGDVRYLTEVDRFGCWTASAFETGGLAPRDRELSGCVTIFDHIGLFDRVLN